MLPCGSTFTECLFILRTPSLNDVKLSNTDQLICCQTKEEENTTEYSGGSRHGSLRHRVSKYLHCFD